ncbi:MAG: TldD/PmbA family protein [Leptospira sp.]|uniref:TldD/PmbA family protein n=1 Tax=Leptospira sp. TaxID=178 RepID=UPI0025C4B648|nr:TldD/PmbA family protein [Leptospira sp.]MBL0956298.1 TldD/PmbA family protein [Leptospira sp.]
MDRGAIEKRLNDQKDLLTNLISKAKSNGIEQVEIYSSYGYSEDVSLEKNDLNNCTATEENMFGIRVIHEGNQGFLISNHIPSLYTSIEEAYQLAKSQSTPDPDLVLPEPRPLTNQFDTYDSSLDTMGIEDLVSYAKEALGWRSDLYDKINIDSGDFSLSKGYKLIVSSKGVMAHELGAELSASVMGMGVDGDLVGSFDYDSASGFTKDQFQSLWKKAFHNFGDKCMGALYAKPTTGFQGKVLLPPDAVYSFFLGLFIGSLNGTSLRKGKSKMAGKMGEKVASSLLSIWDDPTNKGFMGSTGFDREGMPTTFKEVLTEGVLESYFYNTYEAKKANLSISNGCATGGAQSLPGCGPKQLQIAPGNANKDEFFKLPGKTLFVNRISGTKDGASGDFSGVVKGGYLLEGGEKIPVREVQIVGNAFDALNQIEAIAKEGELIGESSFVPYMLLDGFTITGVMEN